MANAGQEGVTVSVAGTDVTSSTLAGSCRLSRPLGEVSTARFGLRGHVGDFTIPSDGDLVEIEDTGAGRTIFGGRIRNPAVEVMPGAGTIDVRVRCSGHERRFGEVVVGHDDGIRIANLDSAAEQITELVALLGGEGFSTAMLPDLGDRYPGDMRFRPIDRVLRDITRAARAVWVLSPARQLSVHLVSNLPASGFTLDTGNAQRASREVDAKDYRSRQTVIGNRILQAEQFTGDGAETAFRLGTPSSGTSGSGNLPAPSTVTQTGALWIPDSQAFDLELLSDPPGEARGVQFLGVFGVFSGQPRWISLNVTGPGGGQHTDLTPAWESSPVAITVSNPNLAADLVIPGPTSAFVEANDPNEPYQYSLTAAAWINGGFPDWLSAHNALTHAQRLESTAVFSDGVSVSDILSVEDVTDLEVDGSDVDLGRSDSGWEFDPAKQSVVADPAAADGSNIIVKYRARNVSVDDSGDSPRVDRVAEEDVANLEEAAALARSRRLENAAVAERLAATLPVTALEHLDPGETVALDTALAGLLGVENPDPNDAWVVTESRIFVVNKWLRYSISCQRDRFQTPTLEFWRRLLGS